MKKLRSILAVLLAVAMLMSFAVVAFADDAIEESAETPATEEQQDAPEAVESTPDPAVAPTPEPVVEPEQSDEDVAAAPGSVKTPENDVTEVVDYIKNGKIMVDKNGNKREPTCADGYVTKRTEVYDKDGIRLSSDSAPYIVDHTWGDWKVTTPATCTEGGVETRTCSVCKTTETRAVKALGHLWSSDEKAEDQWGKIIEDPTCTENGKAVDYCERCGLTREEAGAGANKYRDILAPGHIFGERVVDTIPHCYYAPVDGNKVSTYTVEDNEEFVYGSYHVVCSVCGAVMVDEKGKTVEFNDLTVEEYEWYLNRDNGPRDPWIEYDGHDWDAWITELPATCYKEGKATRWCKHCGEDEVMIIPAHNHHEYADFVLQQDHLLDCFNHYNVYICSSCGDEFHGVLNEYPWGFEFEEGEAFPTESHVYPSAVEAEMKADKTIDNATYEKWLKDKTISPYIVEKSAPDCDDNGYVIVKCIFTDTVDGHDDGDNVKIIVSAIGHKFTPWVMEHAVGENGNEYGHWTRQCTVCKIVEDFNGNYSPEECAVNAHNYQVLSTDAATCTEDGLITKVCTICGDTITESIKAEGHKWDAGVAAEASCTEAGSTTYTCTVCGATRVEAGAAAAGHSWNDGEVVVEASCKGEGVDGKILYTCTACDAIRVETVAAPEHKVIDDPAVEAKVGEAGKTAGSHCEVCGEVIVAQEEIPAIIANTYDIDLENVAVDNATSGKGAVKVEGTEEIGKLYARVSWIYTLSDGQTLGYAAMKEVIETEDGFVFDTKSPSTPYGATLDAIYVALTTDGNADQGGEYDALALAQK